MGLFRLTMTYGLAAARAFSVGGAPFGAPNALAFRGGQIGRSASTMMSAATMPQIEMTSASVMPSTSSAEEWSGDLLVVPFWEVNASSELSLGESLSALDASVDGALADLVAEQDFKGAVGSTAVVSLPRGSKARRLAVVGLGKQEGFAVSGARKFGEELAAVAKAHKPKALGTLLPTSAKGVELTAAHQQAAVEAALLALSADMRFKSEAARAEEANRPPPLQTIELLGGADTDACERARTIAAGVLLTKSLVAAPANVLTPTSMASVASELASEHECLSLTVLDRAECEALGMGAYLAVSQGACEPPKFVHLTYTPPGASAGASAKRVALIGKGLTFDSGGYNLKAGAGSMIEKMKFDMGGAGAVLGAARALATLQPAGIEVHFIVAACENMVSAEAMRPGDVLTASNGKTIEVLNTDAEGRLTLADALVYADRLGDLDAIVDVATLTGACIVALGPDYAAVYTDDDGFHDALQHASSAGGERLWRMPLAPEYVEQIKSPIADLANLGAPTGGGSITAALFLKEFVHDQSPRATWAHLDIAGPVWNDKKGGATGFGVRTLVGLVETLRDD